MHDALIEILQPSRPTAVVDIGANPVDGTPPYQSMLKCGHCQVIGFEPQPEALAKLKQRAAKHETYLPHALADGRKHTLYVCRASGMTSLLEPDVQRLKQFNLFETLGSVIETREIETVRLDDVEEIKEIDFLKIDAQGSELTIFENGGDFLKRAAAIQLEVSFIPLYVNQPCFGHMDLFLRRYNFVPHCFKAIKRWSLSPTIFNKDPRVPGNQLLESDIVYVKDFTHLSAMESEKLKHFGMLAHYVFHSIDLTVLMLKELERRGEIKSDSVKAYLASLVPQKTK